MAPKYRTSTTALAKIDNDIVLVCCDGVGFVGGYVAKETPVVSYEDPNNSNSRRTEKLEYRWFLSIYAGGDFKLKHFNECPYCGLNLNRIHPNVV